MNPAANMRIYLVGGAVRDGLLGLAVAERDWVVVGADAAAMRAQGFVPADRDFPVFLHAQTGEEYALARREVKRGEGYRGFEVYAGPDVTLEEDLRRRDLTVNAMARDAQGRIIDPYGGRDDLDKGLLRNVSPAFAEDPLRVLRVARFAARLGSSGFRVAHATHRLMCRMVERGEMAHLTPERLWREMMLAMQTEQPWRFFEVLHRCGALAALIPVLAAAMGKVATHDHACDSLPIAALKRATRASDDGSVRLASALCPCLDTVDQAELLMKSLRADRETALLLRHVVAGRPLCDRVQRGDPDALVELVTLWRGFDPAVDLDAPVVACEAQLEGAVLGRFLASALPAARAVSASQLRDRGLSGAALGQALAAARRGVMLAALRAAGLIT
jgi:tRNA nucleotidyltransferase (CCA-adding enzyme)